MLPKLPFDWTELTCRNIPTKLLEVHKESKKKMFCLKAWWNHLFQGGYLVHFWHVPECDCRIRACSNELPPRGRQTNSGAIQPETMKQGKCENTLRVCFDEQDQWNTQVFPVGGSASGTETLFCGQGLADFVFPIGDGQYIRRSHFQEGANEICRSFFMGLASEIQKSRQKVWLI